MLTKAVYADITADGLVIRRTKFKKSRLVPLHARGDRRASGPADSVM
jgi:hypothetical protein